MLSATMAQVWLAVGLAFVAGMVAGVGLMLLLFGHGANAELDAMSEGREP